MEREFTVPGTPVPKGSKNVGRYGQVYEQGGARLKEWLNLVAQVSMLHRRNALFDRDCGVDLIFRVRRIGDVDKLARGVLDGLQQGGLLSDDKHVVWLSVERERAASPKEVGCDVRIWTLDD